MGICILREMHGNRLQCCTRYNVAEFPTQTTFSVPVGEPLLSTLRPPRPRPRASPYRPPRSPSPGQPCPRGPRRIRPPPCPLPRTSERRPSWHT